MDDRLAIDEVYGSHDAILKFLFGSDADMAEGRPRQLRKEATDLRLGWDRPS